MNVKPATTHPQATQEIDGMIAMIETLIEKGYAYAVDGTVYFRTRKFEEYGKLSHKNLDDLRSGNRSLWYPEKIRKKIRWISYSETEKEGEPFWVSPWGEDVRDGISSVPSWQKISG